MRSKWLWAALAVVAVLGITTAAGATTRGLITGKQIAPHTINSKHLVNHTIQAHDLSQGLVKSLHGARGATGPMGPAGPQGPQGPPGLTPSFAAGQWSPEVPITAVGTGDIGMANDANPGTPVVSLTLPQGVYLIQTLADVRKPSGSEIFSCWAREAATGQWTALGRAAAGNDSGYAKWVALTGSGFFNAKAGGSTVTLECWNWQATGENPIVFLSEIKAVPVTSATITVNGGSPIHYP
jgi:hypothetical protein